MKYNCRYVLVLALGLGMQAPAFAADATRGKALYENHCIGCHTDSVHKRENKKATNRDEVAAFVARWEKEMNLKWSAEERADVTEYVSATYYKF